MTVAELRQEVLYVNKMLATTGLVTMHSGNASGYDPRSNTVLIKPSGVDYDRLTAEALVMVDVLSGERDAVSANDSAALQMAGHAIAGLFQRLESAGGFAADQRGLLRKTLRGVREKIMNQDSHGACVR